MAGFRGCPPSSVVHVSLLALLTLAACTSRTVSRTDHDSPAAEIFGTKCSACHDLERALYADKDELAWRETIRRMQEKPGSSVLETDVEKLVSFHANRRHKEQQVFNDRCTGCHPAERSLAKIRTRSEVRDLVLRMSAKEGEIVTDDEADLLIGFHMRNYNRIERALQANCTGCHDLDRVLALAPEDERMQRTVAEMVERSGQRVSTSEVLKFVDFHRVRETEFRTAAFGKDCTTCHEYVHRKSGENARRIAEERMRLESTESPGADMVEIRVAYHREARRTRPRSTEPEKR